MNLFGRTRRNPKNRRISFDESTVRTLRLNGTSPPKETRRRVVETIPNIASIRNVTVIWYTVFMIYYRLRFA